MSKKAKLNIEFLKESIVFSNGKIARVFGQLDNMPPLYLLHAGVIISQTPGRVLKYYLESQEWTGDTAQNKKMLNTLTMLSYLDNDDQIVSIRMGNRISSFSVNSYEVPSNLGLNLVVNTGNKIYTNEAAKRRDIRGFERQVTGFDPTMVDAVNFYDFNYDDDNDEGKKKWNTFKSSKDYANFTSLYNAEDDCWQNVMNPKELKLWFENWDNQSSMTWSWTAVEKKELLVSDFGCFISGDDSLYLTCSDASAAKDVLVTVVGIKSKVDVSSMYARMVDCQSSEIINIFDGSEAISNNQDSNN